MQLSNIIHFVYLQQTMSPSQADRFVQWAVRSPNYQIYLWVENTQLHMSQEALDINNLRTVEFFGQQVQHAAHETIDLDDSFISMIRAAFIRYAQSVQEARIVVRDEGFGKGVGYYSTAHGEKAVFLMPINRLGSSLIHAKIVVEEQNTFEDLTATENLSALKALHNFGGIYLNHAAIPMDYNIPTGIEATQGLLFKTVCHNPYIFSHSIIAAPKQSDALMEFAELIERKYFHRLEGEGEFLDIHEEVQGEDGTRHLRFVHVSDYGEEKTSQLGAMQRELRQLSRYDGLNKAERTARYQQVQEIRRRIDLLHYGRYEEHGLSMLINNWVQGKRLKFVKVPEEQPSFDLEEKFSRSEVLPSSNRFMTSNFAQRIRARFKRSRPSEVASGVHLPDHFLINFSFETASGVTIEFGETIETTSRRRKAQNDLDFELI